ncbi:MAG: hypothetical protein EHM23_18120 [Acidobacteria bacterium]|nr:MAG: hypothetical protein EHM23_18120 [Acidobacteriota bacterium]
MESGGPVLGLLPKAVYEEGSIWVSPGDLLVVYSDGLTEATDPSGSEFGEKRLEELILASQNKQPRDRELQTGHEGHRPRVKRPIWHGLLPIEHQGGRQVAENRSAASG